MVGALTGLLECTVRSYCIWILVAGQIEFNEFLEAFRLAESGVDAFEDDDINESLELSVNPARQVNGPYSLADGHR